MGNLTAWKCGASLDRIVSVSRNAQSGFDARVTEVKLERRRVAAAGVIKTSLFEAGTQAGVPQSVLSAMMRALAYNVDFQRDLQPGDRFEVLYERDYTPDGMVAHDGDVVYANLVLGNVAHPLYRYAMPDGTVDYFNHDGESIRKALLRTPVDGARITSGFGMRVHPLLGYTKMHKGVDFGAPIGTPIFAAGDGTIEELGIKNGYGNYIRIRHSNRIATAYGHLSRFAAHEGQGTQVEQGQIIGYVGMSGRATGPHLHFEVLENDQQVNPLTVDMPTGRALKPAQLLVFNAAVERG